jgi:hypothetical protein
MARRGVSKFHSTDTKTLYNSLTFAMDTFLKSGSPPKEVSSSLRLLRFVSSILLIPVNTYIYQTGILNIQFLTSLNLNIRVGFCVYIFTFCNANYFL